MKKGILLLHGWLGLVAGLVFIVVGSTGALMAFEPQILRLLNPGVLTLDDNRSPVLSPAALYAAVSQASPDRPIQALTVSGRADRPSQVTFVKVGNAKGESVLVHPSTGAVLPEVRGEETFELIEGLHRRLLLDDVGKAVTGVSAIILIVMAFSGITLRWLRRPRETRYWLLLRPGLKGRAFYWQLHAVAGTWIFLLLAFSASTGLSWSYDSYKAAIYRALDVELPAKPKAPDVLPPVLPAAEFAARVDAGWSVFSAQVPAYDRAVIALKSLKDGEVKVEYYDADLAHDREKHELLVAADGSVAKHLRFEQRPQGEQLTAAWKMLHTGQYWGWSGQLMLLFSSLALPAFAIIGAYLFVTGRRRRA